MSKTPEEIAALRAKYATDNAEKAAAKAAKKAKFAEANAEKNMPAVEMRIPAELDLDEPPWDNYTDALEWNYRTSGDEFYEGPLRRKIIRT